MKHNMLGGHPKHPHFRHVIRELEQKKSKWTNLGLLVGILALTVVVAELLRHGGMGIQTLLMIYILAVFLISRVTSGYIYGFIAALLGTFLYDFFITDPRMNFSFTLGFPITLLTMLVATFITSTMTIQIKAQARMAQDREKRAEMLYNINQKLLAARDVQTILQATCGYLIDHMHRAAVFYTADPTVSPDAPMAEMADEEGSTDIFHTEAEKKRVHRIFQNGGEDPATCFDDAQPEVLYVPIVSRGSLLGLIGISSHGRPLGPMPATFLHTLTGQVALALELQYLSDDQSRVAVEAEKEKMRSTLLRAISHDLRTPLTSILGASNTILEQEDMSGETCRGLMEDIKDNAQWLIRMVENILTITRISKDTTKVTKTLEAAEEIVSEAVSIVRKRFPVWQFHVRIPEEILMVPMDATLISQVIINLLENAVKNSDEGSLILVSLSRHGDMAKFDICDNGRGIPDQVLDNLFQASSPTPQQIMDASRGIGIGLSICQAIVQAHGGTIEGYNRKEGGAHFTFLLPLQEADRENDA